MRDARGRDTVSTLDENGNVTAVTDANGNTTTFVYDRNNRRTRVIAPDLSERVTAYGNLGRRVSETDQAGRTTQYGYDVLGRLTSVTDALNQVTSYAYDELGNHVSQTDANSHTTRFEYDRAGRRVKRTLPLGMYETMAYDSAGNMAAKADFNGHITTFNYDVMHRLLSKTPDPVLAEPTVSFTYFPTGQRQTMSDATGVTTYAYDDRDRLLEKATPQGTLTYTWDASGNVTSIVSSNVGGTNVQYTWDENNRLKDVIDVHAGTFTYSYDDVGNETGLSYPNGIQKTTTYDAQNRLRTIGYANGISTVASYAYALDVTGRRTGVVEHSGRTVQYGYDALYRLTSEEVTADPNSINGRVEYTYDPVGNRLRRDSTLGPVDDQVFTYNANDQIEGVEQYDLNGNLIQDQDGNTYGWDFENHFSSRNGAEVVFRYDGDGNRVERTSVMDTSRYLMDRQNPTRATQVMDEVTTGSVAVFVHGAGALAELRFGSVSAFVTDGQTSTRLMTSGVGGLFGPAAFDAFGVPIAGLQSARAGYVGEWHAEEGLIYLRARWYAPENGRFLSRDPVLERATKTGSKLHAYGYGDNDPATKVDRLGLFADLVTSSIAVGIADVLAGLQAHNLLGLAVQTQTRALQSAEEESAFAGFAEALNEVDSDVLEYGGQICFNPATKSFDFTGPIEGDLVAEDNNPRKIGGLGTPWTRVPCKAGALLWGTYHTHPIDYLGLGIRTEEPSVRDLMVHGSTPRTLANGSVDVGLDGYLAVPSGRVILMGFGLRRSAPGEISVNVRDLQRRLPQRELRPWRR